MPEVSQKTLQAVTGTQPNLTPQQTPQISNPVTIKKKGFFRGLIKNDFATIKESVLKNVIDPGIRTLIANIIYGITNASLFNNGAAGPGNFYNYYNGTKPLISGGYTAYNGFWNGGNNALKPQQSTPTGPSMTSLTDYKMIEFQTADDARIIFEALCRRIGETGKASVRYLYDECRLSSNDITLDNWGWYDMNCGFQVVPLANGRFHLNLPEPRNFNVKS